MTLAQISQHNEVYRRAGAVHGCALCSCPVSTDPRIHLFVEDVGGTTRRTPSAVTCG